jgi:hypothetical protein
VELKPCGRDWLAQSKRKERKQNQSQNSPKIKLYYVSLLEKKKVRVELGES